MGMPPDEHLPEVVPGNAPQTVPDGSPQALTAQEAYAHQNYFNGTAKYPGCDGDDSPQLTEVPVGLESASYYDHQRQHQQDVPWEPSSPSAGTVLHAGAVPGTSQFGSEGEKSSAPKEELIYGVKKRLFYFVIGTCVVLVSIVVGVGVGVGLSQQNKVSGGGSGSAGGGASPDSGGSGGGDPLTTTSRETPLPQPTGTVGNPNLNETRLNGPFRFQGWSGENFSGNMTEKVRGVGITQFGFNITSYVWDPDGYTCCVTFCNGTRSDAGSFWCGARRQPKSSGTFNRIVTICGGNEITEKAVSCS